MPHRKHRESFGSRGHSAETTPMCSLNETDTRESRATAKRRRSVLEIISTVVSCSRNTCILFQERTPGHSVAARGLATQPYERNVLIEHVDTPSTEQTIQNVDVAASCRDPFQERFRVLMSRETVADSCCDTFQNLLTGHIVARRRLGTTAHEA